MLKSVSMSSEADSGNETIDLTKLPIEVFNSVVAALPSADPTRLLRTSKGWNDHLNSNKSLWRCLEFTLTSKMMGGPSQVRPIPRKYSKDGSCFTGFSPMRLFSIKSGDTLSSVDIEFTPSLDRSHLSNCFYSIGKSSKTLKSIALRGVLINTTGIIAGLKLASSCINLDKFIYSVREEEELDGNPLEVVDSDDEPDIDEYYQQREDIRGAGEEELLLDDLQFKNFPRYISITTDTILAQLELGNGRFFSKAEVLKVKTDQLLEGYSWIDHSGIALIMEVSKATLREFELSQPEEQYFPTRTAEEQELGTEEVPINLPELRDLRIKAEGMLEFDFSGQRVVLTQRGLNLERIPR